MHLPSYRGCWHGISRCFLLRYPQKFVPSEQEFTPKNGVILHAVSLRQTCVHCERFLTAASRRSMGRVSVPFWLIILSDQLPVIALVSHYLTNKLIGRRPLPNRKIFPLAGASGISPPFGGLSLSSGQVPTCYAVVRRSGLILGSIEICDVIIDLRNAEFRIKNDHFTFCILHFSFLKNNHKNLKRS